MLITKYLKYKELSSIVTAIIFKLIYVTLMTIALVT